MKCKKETEGMIVIDKFINSNGKVYEVLAVQEFTEADKEYYKNSWQRHRVALMKNNNTFVVANYVGETSWGNGYYTDNEEQAKREYNRIVEGYLKDIL